MTRIRASIALLLCLPAVALVSAPSAFAQTRGPVKVANLKRTPFEVNGLTMVVQKLDAHVLWSVDDRDVGVAFAAIRLENKTDQFLTFEPKDFLAIGENGAQVSVGYERRGFDRVPAEERRLAPGAHIQLLYNLTARLRSRPRSDSVPTDWPLCDEDRPPDLAAFNLSKDSSR